MIRSVPNHIRITANEQMLITSDSTLDATNL